MYFHQHNLAISQSLSHVKAVHCCHYHTTRTLLTSQSGYKKFHKMTGINTHYNNSSGKNNKRYATHERDKRFVSDGHRKGMWDIGGVAPLTLILCVRLWWVVTYRPDSLTPITYRIWDCLTSRNSLVVKRREKSFFRCGNRTTIFRSCSLCSLSYDGGHQLAR